MRLSSEDGLSRLEFDVCDLELQGQPPRMALQVRVVMSGYAGERKGWFALNAITRFAQELAALTEVSHGAAVLDGLEPGAVQVTLLSPGEELGCVTHVSLASSQKLGGRHYETRLSGALVLPLSALRQASAGFARWCDPKFLADLRDWGFEEKAMLDG